MSMLHVSKSGTVEVKFSIFTSTTLPEFQTDSQANNQSTKSSNVMILQLKLYTPDCFPSGYGFNQCFVRGIFSIFVRKSSEIISQTVDIL